MYHLSSIIATLLPMADPLGETGTRDAITTSALFKLLQSAGYAAGFGVTIFAVYRVIKSIYKSEREGIFKTVAGYVLLIGFLFDLTLPLRFVSLAKGIVNNLFNLITSIFGG